MKNDINPTWPKGAKNFIKTSRDVLGVTDQVIHENTDFPFATRVKFLWFLQNTFKFHNRKQLMMAPVFDVARQHIRMDMICLSDFAARMSECDELKCFTSLSKGKQADPQRQLRSQLSFEKKPTRSMDMDNDQWKETIQIYKDKCNLIEKKRKEVQNSAEFKAKRNQHENFRDSVKNQAFYFFKPFRDKGHNWSASPCILTDGVSLSVEYNKTTLKKKREGPIPKKQKTETVNSEYDPSADSVVGNTLIVGIDPGRTSLVAVATRVNSKTYNFKYTRSQYYTEAKIFKHQEKVKKWDSAMQNDFDNLKNMGGTLRSTTSSSILTYINWYKAVEEKWWLLRLGNKYNRAKLGQYINKRAALDGFCENLKTQVKVLAAGKEIHIAYGACGPTMAPSGKGELAVPTTGIYKSFQRTFGIDKVQLVDEFRTTLISWDTQLKKERVYAKQKVEHDKIKSHLFHTESDYMPKVKRNDMSDFHAVTNFKHKRKKRKKGEKDEEDEEKEEKEPRYVEIRGLRYCTSTHTYLDRDYTAARAIAGLRTLELQGKGRPDKFSRNKTGSYGVETSDLSLAEMSQLDESCRQQVDGNINQGWWLSYWVSYMPFFLLVSVLCQSFTKVFLYFFTLLMP